MTIARRLFEDASASASEDDGEAFDVSDRAKEIGESECVEEGEEGGDALEGLGYSPIRGGEGGGRDAGGATPTSPPTRGRVEANGDLGEREFTFASSDDDDEEMGFASAEASVMTNVTQDGTFQSAYLSMARDSSDDDDDRDDDDASDDDEATSHRQRTPMIMKVFVAFVGIAVASFVVVKTKSRRNASEPNSRASADA